MSPANFVLDMATMKSGISIMAALLLRMLLLLSPPTSAAAVNTAHKCHNERQHHFARNCMMT
jgi:hypothetical protein